MTDSSDAQKNPSGLYPDPEDPSRFHRRGRGKRSARVVRRVTVYVDESLASQLDQFRLEKDRLTRSDVIEAALRAYFEPAPT